MATENTASAHTCGRHCGPGYHPCEVTVRLIEQYEADHNLQRLDGCTCTVIRVSHKPPCAWAMSR